MVGWMRVPSMRMWKRIPLSPANGVLSLRPRKGGDVIRLDRADGGARQVCVDGREVCLFAEEPPTPHRFRHTFVRILLQRGVKPYDVAELIGDTEEMVLKHYARWVPETSGTSHEDPAGGIVASARPGEAPRHIGTEGEEIKTLVRIGQISQFISVSY